MNQRFDDLWEFSADTDELWRGLKPSEEEVEQILEAWTRERSQRIEALLILDQTRRFLRGIVTRDELAPGRIRRARHLLQAIKELGDDLS
ncbi:MAG: hypothetical protein AB7I30_01115 [Isosphaeraceae bacterium]